MESKVQQQLIDAALASRQQAYAPYSKFLVGAAVLAEDGSITAGANVENASYGLTICAERVAVGAAVANGARKLSAVAVVTSGGASPCGACRQVLAEFGGAMDVVLVDADDPTNVRTMTLDELLPEQFEL
ncbi:MAG: cytidine deaminase [Planctomycetes bacterium]|nr:cytidine deaminase [Planctomycetota bacterium]